MPISTAKVIALSAQEYCRAAETTPAAMPMTVQITSAVAGQDQRRREAVDDFVQHRPVEVNERPKSPVSMLPSQMK